ncbi:hypothetical protein BD779DRAFT_419996 [Infundibulicybe gibba]|nr:hypothetical protein BD779DRAFT_419996 [Infundibulicybe gibba]
MRESDVTIRSYSSLAALIFLIWEILATSSDEYKYIWRQNWTSVKCIYLFCRYFSLIVQIANYAITRGPISRIPVAYTTCQTWFAFQITCTASLLCAVNVLLMLRVYALYNKDRRIAVFLTNLLILDTISTIIHGYYRIKTCGFDDACLMMSTPPTHANPGSAGNALGDDLVEAGIQGWTRNPLVCLLVRDGGFIFVGAIALFAMAGPYAFFVKSLGHLIFSWFISLLSFAACRLTINLLRLDVMGVSAQDDVELTSCIEVSSVEQRITTGTGAMHS